MEFSRSYFIRSSHAACLFILIIISTHHSTGYASDQFTIFILHSYSQEYPWTRTQHKGFVDTLYSQSNHELQISTEYLDTKRKKYSKEYAAQFSDYLKNKYNGYTPDLIYVTDDNALKFTLDYIIDIFGETSVIFSGVNDYSVLTRLDREHITGVFEKKEITQNLKFIYAIDEPPDEILIVGDDSNTYRAIRYEISEQLTDYPRVKANYISSNKIDEVAEELKSSKTKYLFLTTIGGFIDSKNKNLTINDSIKKISASGDFIIFSMEDTYLDHGILGGYVTSGSRQGITAAKLALENINGKAVSDIYPVLDSPNAFIFDHKELTRRNISIPPAFKASTIILNSPPSFYEKHKFYIISSIIILFTLLLILLTSFLFILSFKNSQIKKHTLNLKKISDTLNTAQQIAHLGNWEWNLTTGKASWSEETYRIFDTSPEETEASYENILKFIPDDEREKIDATIKETLRTLKPYEIEHRILTNKHKTVFIRQIGCIHKNKDDDSIILIGTLHDITRTKQNENTELERLSKIERYQEALIEWSRVDYENLEQAIQRATEISSNTLDVERVSIWLYNDDYTSIQCHDLFQKDIGHTKGLELFKSDYPDYFMALSSNKMIVVNDARNDERTQQFTDSYLIPNNIYSMLDAPIYYAGEIIGVVCHEHTDDIRIWTSQDQEFAAAISNTVSLSMEVQRRKSTEQKLEHQAYHDALTGLPNRLLFMDRLDHALKHAKRSETLLAVLFLDLDNFKGINDSLGHAAGDMILISVADRLNSNLREMDTISRLGGDEFTVIVSDFNEIQHIHEIVIKLFHILQQPIAYQGKELYTTSSIGISIYPYDGNSADILLKNADAAMYKAKEAGRNNFEFYTHDMTEKAFERALMETNLRKALEQDEFFIQYQPQYNANDDSIIGLEALIRWQHPEMGIVPPAKFIPVAEHTGLIVDIDRWVMRAASKQFSAWYEQGLYPGKLSLNMATKQLERKDFVHFIINCLEDSHFKPEWLSIEITESQIMKDPEEAVRLLLELSKYGIEIAVDDFGTGYSSLTYLKRLPVNKLKIDRAFVKDIPHNDEDNAIIRAIIALSRSLNIDVIAEGVEHREQVDFLLSEGCHEIQGFYYSRPVDREGIEKLLLIHKDT